MKTVDEIYLTPEELVKVAGNTQLTEFIPKYIALDDFVLHLCKNGRVEDDYHYKWDWLTYTLTTDIKPNPKKGNEHGRITEKVLDVRPLHTQVDIVATERLAEFLSEEHPFYGRNASGLFAMFVYINVFLCSIDAPERVLIKTPKTVTEQADHKKRNGKRKKPKVYIRNEYRLIKEFESVKRHRPHSFSCPAWGVRGHYRHYKDGRVIFIKPYIKGTKKSEYRGKEYVLADAKVVTDA